MRDWCELSVEEQLALREAYGRDPASQLTSCSLEAKTLHFSLWLAERGVAFSAADVQRNAT